MYGLSAFCGIYTFSLLLTVLQYSRNFRWKKVVFFARGITWRIWKILVNYILFFMVKHQISGTTPKSKHTYPPWFSWKKGNHFGKIFSGKFYKYFPKIYNNAYFNILYHFYLRWKPNFFRRSINSYCTKVNKQNKGFYSLYILFI